MPTAMRTTARLNEAEATLVENLKKGGSDESLALHALTHTTVIDASTAEAVHALIEAGYQAIREKALEIGYRRAAEYEKSHPEVQAWRTAMHGRHLRSFMDVSEQTDGAA